MRYFKYFLPAQNNSVVTKTMIKIPKTADSIQGKMALYSAIIILVMFLLSIIFVASDPLNWVAWIVLLGLSLPFATILAVDPKKVFVEDEEEPEKAE